MIGTIFIVLCFCSLRITARCPLLSCGSDIYGTSDLSACLTKVEGAATCVQNTLKQSDICQRCDRWDISHHVFSSYTSRLKRYYCYRKPCKLQELGTCMRDIIRVLYFFDTSKVDNIISCVDNWKPDLDSRTCVKEVVGMDIPGFVDPIILFKQILTDVKGGCDLVLPLVECRKHLQPFAAAMIGGPGSRESLSTETITKTVQDTIACIQTAIKQYPCKTIEGLLSTLEDTITDFFVRAISDKNPGRRDEIYNKYCGANDNPKFSMFSKK